MKEKKIIISVLAAIMFLLVLLGGLIAINIFAPKWVSWLVFIISSIWAIIIISVTIYQKLK